MKSLFVAGLIALSAAPFGAIAAKAEDVGAAIARDAVRGALGEPAYGERDRYRDEDRGYRRDRDYRREGRSEYQTEGCRTVTVEHDDGTVTRRRRCD